MYLKNNREQIDVKTAAELLDKVEARKGRLSDYLELTKPRLSFLSVITALVGYLVANPDRNWELLISLLIGTSFAAGGAGALNQWLEDSIDAKMVRTRNRPVPAGDISKLNAFLFGSLLSIFGVGLISIQINFLAGVLTLATVASYLCVYTPLKQKSYWNTHLGAIPGAIPPLIGWAAAENGVGGLGWILFAILFAWQIPHFMAIAWTYREDYSNAGLKMLTVTEPTGRSAGLHSIVFTLLLLVLSVLPAVLGWTTWFYGVSALISGGYFLLKAIHFVKKENRNTSARALFFASIMYLPFIMAALVIDRCFIF